MHHTIFDTPLLNTLLRAGSRAFLHLARWRVEGCPNAVPTKCVLIAAPHTSNWDLPYTLMAAFALGMKPYWMGKASLFRAPFGAPMRWLGGIAVNREQSNNAVAASVAALAQAVGPAQLIVAPEGTRRATRQWKTGFYYIALGAGVPIQLAYISHRHKRVGLGPLLQPSGDMARDMVMIKAFYAPFLERDTQQPEAG